MAAKATQTKKSHMTTFDITSELGIPVLTPSQLERHLLICKQTNQSVLILGRPGGGKTTIVHKVCDMTKTYAVVRRVNGMDPTDLGLPYVYEDNNGIKRHSFTVPDFFFGADDDIPEEYPGGVAVFFDEVPQGLPAMQNRIREMLQERTLSGRKVNDKVWFVLAGNFAQDKAATYPIPKQLLNCLSVVALAPDLEDFFRFCSTHNIRPEIPAFAKLFPDCLDSYDPDSMINCTSRSLCTVSPLMDTNPPMDAELDLYSSRIGKGWGAQFTGFLQVFRDLPKLEDIVKSPMRTELPDEDRTDVLCALAAMLGRALNYNNADSVIKYLQRLPAEFCVFAMRDAFRRNAETGGNLHKHKAMTQWAYEHGDVIN